MLDRLRVMFGGFDWTNPDDRERAFRSSIATDALARAFGEWYFVYKRSSPETALSLISDVFIEILDVRGEAAAEQFLDIADPSEI
jgi:hypothetical protein